MTILNGNVCELTKIGFQRVASVRAPHFFKIYSTDRAFQSEYIINLIEIWNYINVKQLMGSYQEFQPDRHYSI